MVIVAVAGGTTGIGSNIVREILATKKHELIVLSRSPKPELTSRGVKVRVINYDIPTELSSVLQGVHTLISCIWSYGSDFVPSQLSLLEATKQAGVSRFVSSDWATTHYESVDVYAPKRLVWEAVEKSGLEYTRFNPGLWMNLWGVNASYHEAEATSGYGGPPFLIDLNAGTATVPGDGTQQLVFTTMTDVGRFVAASLDLDKWESNSQIMSDKLTYNDVVKTASEVTGKTLTVQYMSVRQLEDAIAANTDLGPRFAYQLMLGVANGLLDFEPTLNSKFPDIKTMTAREFFSRYWAGL